MNDEGLTEELKYLVNNYRWWIWPIIAPCLVMAAPLVWIFRMADKSIDHFKK